MKRYKVFLLDKHEIFLTGLTHKLKPYFEEIEIIGEALNFARLNNELLKGNIPDVLILDYNLPDKNGIEIVRSLKQKQEFQQIKTIILSDYTCLTLTKHNYELLKNAIDTGINGYLLKDSKIEDIIEAVRKVMSGESFVLGKTMDLGEINKEIIEDRKRLLLFLKRQNNFSLTDREIEIVKLLSEGYSSKQIGVKLKISEEAVTNHKDNIKLKLKEKYNINIKNVVELIVWAIRNKII